MKNKKIFISYIYKLLPLLTVSLLVVVFGSIIASKSSQQAQAQTDSFSFGAAGDYSSTSNTDAVLTTVKNSGVNFQIAVGDLSYDTKGSPAGWGTYVKNIIGTVPFPIIMGNHDASQIDEFVAALPNPMSNVQGDYGKQYYFDYPATSPIARFILISPVDGSLDNAWLTNAIDSAKSSGIQWVIAGMHQPCVTAGTKEECESGEALTNQLISKKVDVILYGHEHNYQRSKQLTCVKAGSFDSSCVAKDGSAFTQGAGTVMAIVGMGGNSFYTVSPSDSEAGYYAAMNSDTYGILKFTVSKSQIGAQFVKAAGGSFSDSFTISASTTTPSGTLPSGAVVPSQVISSVPWNYLVPCPTCNGPSVVPLPSGSSVTGTVPSGSAVSPAPTDPCVTGEASIAHGKKKKGSKHSKHRNHRGEIGNWMESLLKFLIELINKLIERFGGTPLSPDILDEDQNPEENPVEEQPCDPVEQEPSGTITQPVTEPSSVPSVVVSPVTSSAPSAVPSL